MTALLLIFIAVVLSACGMGGLTEEAPVPTVFFAATPEPEPEPDTVDVLIAQMGDNELIGQMVMIGFGGTEDMDEQSIALMQNYFAGNILLLGRNTLSFSQTAELVEKINAYNAGEIPLLFGIDFEGGRVIRFKDEPVFESALSLGDAGDPRQVYAQYKQMGEILRRVGIQMNLAPVLDISKDPSSAFMNERMFGSDPIKVSMMTREAIRGLHDAGIVCTGKHFPGHGETAEDSHTTLPVINLPVDDMEKYALIPFQAAIDEGVDAMMAAHILYPEVDSEHTASVSYVWITKVLREKMGFDGVVLTDDLLMLGLLSHCPAGEGAVAHILAGGDMVLIANDFKMQTEVFESLHNAVREGRLSRERLEQSVRRILKMKFKYAEVY